MVDCCLLFVVCCVLCVVFVVFVVFVAFVVLPYCVTCYVLVPLLDWDIVGYVNDDMVAGSYN